MIRHGKRLEALENVVKANRLAILVVDSFGETGEPYIGHAWSSELGLVKREAGETEEGFRQRVEGK